MKHKKLLLFVATAIFTFISGCSKDDFDGEIGICPTVTQTSPASAATNVALNAAVTATFNTEIDPTTINANSFRIVGTSPISGTISYAGTTASFIPNANLTPNTTYVATISTTVQDLFGNALQEDYIWSFSTGAALLPMVAATTPTSNETGVVLNKTIAATFNMPMNPATINNTTFTLSQGSAVISGAVSYSGNTAFFAPTTNLLPNTVYTATITTGTENLASVGLANNYTWQFTTGSGIAPRVIPTSPVNNESGVILNKIITANFDMAMDPTTITNLTFIVRQGNTNVTGIIALAGNTASFRPAVALLANTLYTATITTGARNTTGINLANNFVWSFTTAATTTSINLGTAARFGAFSGSAGVTNEGINTVINDSLGTTGVSTIVTGFHDATAIYTETPLNKGLVTNGIFTAPPLPSTAASMAIATQGLADANAAYLRTSPESMPGGTDPGAGELGGLTLTPGVYKSASGTFKITNGDLTLDAQGNPNATWVFQTAEGLTVGIAGPTGAKSVVLINEALPKNVFWHVGSAATINAAGGGTMVGTIISSAGVTLSTAGNAVQTVLDGRAISLVASVTMVNTTINVPN